MCFGVSICRSGGASMAPMFQDDAFVERLDSVPYLLGVQNGVVDLRDGTVRERRPEDMVYVILDVEYDPNADASLMQDTVLSAMADDQEMAAFLQKLLGYGITGEVCEEVFPVFTGSGRNSKGLLTQTLQHLLGDTVDHINRSVAKLRPCSTARTTWSCYPVIYGQCRAGPTFFGCVHATIRGRGAIDGTVHVYTRSM